MSYKVEALGRCLRLLYDKADGHVLGTSYGGGAGASLTGDDYLIWLRDDKTAPERIGCIEEYFKPIGSLDPESVDLTKIQSCHDAVDRLKAARKGKDPEEREAALENLMTTRDAAVTFKRT